MNDKIIYPICKKDMERLERKISAVPGIGENGNRYPREETYIKYKCLNHKCSNYEKEFDEDDLKG